MTDALPEGTVTILFTDVEASTELHVQRGDAAAGALLTSYEQMVRDQVRTHDGVAVKSLGDGIMAAFSSARKAVACAVAIQRALDGSAHAAEPKPRIRVGLHSGEVTRSDTDLQGVAVSAAARVAAKATGGQILVAAVVKDLAGVMPGVSFANRGRYRLKGFPERWQLFEVVWRQQPEPAHAAATLTERSAFVGRDRERAQITAALDRALHGQGGLVMIGGEPGVGKTRLCEEVMRDAEQRGYRVLLGRCYESEAAVPYMPFVEILEKASQVVDPEVFLQALGDSAPEVARILPRLRRMFPQIPAPLELPPEQERRYLFNSIDEFLRRGAEIRPQVAVLEDLHWADDSTLLLLQHLAAQLPGIRMLVLGTYRDVELGVARPLANTLETLIRSGEAQRLSLRRLDEAGVGAMLRSLGGSSAPPALVNAVFRETEGNPFFVQEVFKYLAEKGALLDAHGAFRNDIELAALDVPESLRLVIGRRLERLSDASRGILAGAAVLGREFSYRLLELVSDVTPDALLDAVDEAERAHIISAGEGRDVKFTFSHELVRQTLLNQLSTPRRQRLHLRCAGALETVLGREVDAHIAEVAHHLFEAGAFADVERTVTALRKAAERALDAAAYEDALHLLDRALQVVAPDDALTLARINENLGLALRGVGRHEEAMAKWESALTTYEQHEDADSIVRLASTMATQLNWAGRQMDAVIAAARGLAAVSDAALSVDRMRLMGLSAVAFSFAGDYQSAEQQGTEAYEIARASGDPALVASAGAWLTLHKFFWAESAQAIEIGDAAADTLRNNGAWWELCDLLAGGLIWARFFRGELDATFADGEECLTLAHRVGHTAAEAAASRVHIVDAMRRGDLTRASGLVHRHLDAMASSGFLWAFDTYAYAAYVDFLAGDWAAARAEVEEGEAREIPCAFAGIPTAFRALLSAYLGHDADVMQVLAARRDALPAPDGVAAIGSWVLAGALVEALFIVGAYDDAASLAGTAEDMIGRGVVNWVAVQLTHTNAGLAAAAAGRWDGAEDHFRQALRDADALRYPPLAADARRLYATALIERGPSGRTEDGRSLLGEALAMYRAIAMTRHAELTEALLQRVG